MNGFSNRRFLCLWLRRLSANRIARSEARTGADNRDEPLVVAGPVKNALRIAGLNDAAASLSLKEGMALSDARAMYPSLRVAQHEPEKDAALLREIGFWCLRYTPLAGTAAPDSLFLDITGCAHLFGGEKPLLVNVLSRLKGFGFQARGAIASSPGCAWAQAHYGKSAVVPSRETRSSLMELPIAALRAETETVTALAQSGLVKIGDIAHRPRAPLAARFGIGLLQRLDQAMGLAEETIAPLIPKAPFSVGTALAEPITREEDVLTVLTHLAGRLSAVMEKQGQGGRAFEALLFRVDGKCVSIALSASRPLRDPSLLRRLFAERLARAAEDRDVGFGYDLIRLSATRSDSMTEWQESLDADKSRDTAHFVDRVAARLGADRVLRFVVQDTHVPEAAMVALPLGAARDAVPLSGAPPQDTLGPERPLRLFGKPQPVEVIAEFPDGPPSRFRWRRVLHDVTRSEGPERIAMEWWNSEGLTRDYFRIEDRTGARFWLYREGIYNRETLQPRWFVHGVFA